MCRATPGQGSKWFHRWSERVSPPIDLREYGLLLTPQNTLEHSDIMSVRWCLDCGKRSIEYIPHR